VAAIENENGSVSERDATGRGARGVKHETEVHDERRKSLPETHGEATNERGSVIVSESGRGRGNEGQSVTETGSGSGKGGDPDHRTESARRVVVESVMMTSTDLAGPTLAVTRVTTQTQSPEPQPPNTRRVDGDATKTTMEPNPWQAMKRRKGIEITQHV